MAREFAFFMLAAWQTIASAGHVEVTAMADSVKLGNHNPPVYTAYDDASWAITSRNLSTILGEAQKNLYTQFMDECTSHGINTECMTEEEDRVYQNAAQPISCRNYTSTGFKKIQAPDDLYKLLKDFWDLNHNRARVEYNEHTPFHNSWQVPTSILMTEEEQFIGGGWNLSAAVWNAARDVLEEWTGQKLAGSSVYGIRIYHNQSILAPHVDRLPLVSSAIINVAQDVEEDWPLEVYGHDGKATNITMKPGDMILYESHSVIHGRPFPLNGKFYANIFVHFQTIGDTDSKEPLPKAGNLPPYLIEGSEWEEAYREEFPHGWTLLTDINELARKGDLYTMRYVAQRDVSAIKDPSKACAVFELAARNHHIAVLEFLIDEMEYDVNMVCTGRTILDFAQAKLPPNDPVIGFLKSREAFTYQALIEKFPMFIATSDYQCTMIRKAITFESVDVLEFLFEEEQLGFDINTVCDGVRTPLDLLLDRYGDNEEPDEDTDKLYAFLVDNEAKEYLKMENRDSLSTNMDSTNRCTVLKAAIPFESAPLIEFLVEVMHFDINMVCDSLSLLDMAIEEFGEDHDIVDYIQSYEGRSFASLVDKSDPRLEAKIVLNERCIAISKAIKSSNKAACDFLFHDLGYDINTVCVYETPLDMALEEKNQVLVDYLVARGGSKFEEVEKSAKSETKNPPTRVPSLSDEL